jgi:internalin A
MRKFGLCFRLSERGERFLVPELLGKEQPPEAAEFRAEACLNFEYHYPTVLPEGVLPRFIVQIYALSADEPRLRRVSGGVRWASGAWPVGSAGGKGVARRYIG